MRAIVTVTGKDTVGIIAGVCTELSGLGVNILDISQTVMEGFFTMTMLIDMKECLVPFAEISEKLSKKGEEMNLSIRVQREDIFDKMHRI